jgi:L-lactate dehydrogenase complex protein LldG
VSARDRILGRLRAAPAAAPPPRPDVAGWFASRRRDEDPAARAARLRGALEAAHAEVHDTTACAWPGLLRGIAAAKGLRNLLIGAGTPHGRTLEADPAASLRLVRYERDVESWRDALFEEVDAALTHARSAIAETGTLVLWPDAREPRLMSLVPPVHFVLLDAGTIHADLHAAMAGENWKDGLPANALLISGPSKTADIQQTLAYGAHGPKELIVLLRHPEGSAA